MEDPAFCIPSDQGRIAQIDFLFRLNFLRTTAENLPAEQPQQLPGFFGYLFTCLA